MLRQFDGHQLHGSVTVVFQSTSFFCFCFFFVVVVVFCFFQSSCPHNYNQLTSLREVVNMKQVLKVYTGPRPRHCRCITLRKVNRQKKAVMKSHRSQNSVVAFSYLFSFIFVFGFHVQRAKERRETYQSFYDQVLFPEITTRYKEKHGGSFPMSSKPHRSPL